jgi:hypothetical protein
MPSHGSKPRHPKELPAAILPNATELDRLFITALNLKLSLEQKLAKPFGPVTTTSNSTEVYGYKVPKGNQAPLKRP